MSEPALFDLAGPLPHGRAVIEASAGTGKTYTIAALAARFVAGETAAVGRSLGAGVPIDELLVVTFTRAAAAELRDRIRAKLQSALAVVDGGAVPESDPWLRALDGGGAKLRRRRAHRLRDALARYDEATITTIHGFCHQALAQAGLAANADTRAELVESGSWLVAEVCRDLLVRELADDPYRLSNDESGRPVEFLAAASGELRRPKSTVKARQPIPPAKIERRFVTAVHAVLTNAGARRAPDASIGDIAGHWARLVSEAVEEITDRQRRLRVVGYDRLVSDLATAIADPGAGAAIARQLGNRYSLVLVDEFQDTDRLQWSIFDTAFGAPRHGGALVVVGDPKQAIYRFRGADVHAYLDAVRDAVPATLATNFRSDRRLLDALDLLFSGATLGHPDIAVRPVEAATGATDTALVEKQAPRDRRRASRRPTGAAVHFRAIAFDPQLAGTENGKPKPHLEAGAAARLVLTDVASRVRDLLDHATITDRSGASRQMRPDDIAVLVPSQQRAADVAAALRDWDIPSVRARTGSVLETPAARQWRLLLAGLADPTRAPVARAAGLSWFFAMEPADLADAPGAPGDLGDVGGGVGPAGGDVAAAVESPLVRLQQRLALLSARLQSAGVGGFYARLRAESRLVSSTLGAPGGDRNLADCDHIADLLVAELRGAPAEPRHVQQTLDRLIADADGAPEATMRRIDTDDDAVHITTIHGSKGLEYPVVLLPFSYPERRPAFRPYVYNTRPAPRDGSSARVVDVASWAAWNEGDSSPDVRKAAANAEVDGDGLRALYVAMTRARHRLEIWWAPTQRARTSALGRLLLDRDGPGRIHNSPIGEGHERLPVEEIADRARAQIDRLAKASHGTIAVFDVPVDQPIRQPLTIGAAEPGPPVHADGSSRHPLADPSWRTWSFTAIGRAVERGGSDGASGADAAPAGADRAGGSIEPEPVGGADEEPTAVDGEVPVAGGALLDIAGGTTFGTMVHEVLEVFDPAAADHAAALGELVEAAAARHGLAVDRVAVASGLAAAVATPLGPLFADRSLADLPVADRLAELVFDLRLADGIDAAGIGEVLAATLPADDPLRPYADQLVTALAPVTLSGWLTGSIDGVFRVDGRYVVVDYKTNRLPGQHSGDLDAYRPDRLVAGMTHHHYPLQALLYAVGLHRYLRWRLGAGYDPEVHLGGAAYLFVRGMIGPDTPVVGGQRHGVFSWRPPAETIAAIDELLGGRR